MLLTLITINLLVTLTTSFQSVPDFEACLKNIVNSPDVTFPRDGLKYELARTGVRNLISSFPAAVIYPGTVSEVQQAVKCARAFGYNPVPRSGGHSFEGLSSLGNALVIDFSEKLNKLTVNVQANTATAEPGIRLGNLYTALAQAHPDLMFSAGTCPSVGLGGHVSAGGYGMISRKYGLAADNILSATIVNYNGEIISCSASKNPDLFFALRGGGGGSYGIVVQYELNLFKVPLNAMAKFYWKITEFMTVFPAWYNWATPSAPKELTMQLTIADGYIKLLCHYTGSVSDFQKVLDASGISFQKLDKKTIKPIACSALGSHSFGDSDPKCSKPELVKTYTRLTSSVTKETSRSVIEFYESLTEAQFKTFYDIFRVAPSNAFFQFEAFGGYFNEVSETSIAYPHRGNKITSLHYAIKFSTPYVQSTNPDLVWIEQTTRKLNAFSTGAHYEGYVDFNVPAESYFGPNYNKLVTVKKQFDPHGIFSHASGVNLTPLLPLN
ncbi:hypothetical protein HK099_004933 [Clydaea vesicula]|uniref:FAD-binding PCMH-type domain-containing protein n=1 Tax=Clydaea vesicula TaxID=447962 RepID=A0AAD5U4F9_9FUNG|nr:hypothetical protein HK099_004933 [Clydaea vesicula]